MVSRLQENPGSGGSSLQWVVCRSQWQERLCEKGIGMKEQNKGKALLQSVAALALLAVIGLAFLLELRPVVILSGSMEPVIPTGSICLISGASYQQRGIGRTDFYHKRRQQQYGGSGSCIGRPDPGKCHRRGSVSGVCSPVSK